MNSSFLLCLWRFSWWEERDEKANGRQEQKESFRRFERFNNNKSFVRKPLLCVLKCLGKGFFVEPSRTELKPGAFRVVCVWGGWGVGGGLDGFVCSGMWYVYIAIT